MWKKIIKIFVALAVTLCAVPHKSFTQSTVPLRGDTIRVYKQGDSSFLKVDSFLLVTAQVVVGKSYLPIKKSIAIRLSDSTRAIKINEMWSRHNIAEPEHGMFIYEDSTNAFLRYEDSQWKDFASAGANWANTNLTVTANRTHDLNNKTMTFTNNKNWLWNFQQDNASTFEVVDTKGFFFENEGSDGGDLYNGWVDYDPHFAELFWSRNSVQGYLSMNSDISESQMNVNLKSKRNSHQTNINLYNDSLYFDPYSGNLNIESLRMANGDTAGYKPMVWNTNNHSVRYFNSWGELGIGGTNIYNSDGTLTANRTLTGNQKSMTWDEVDTLDMYFYKGVGAEIDYHVDRNKMYYYYSGTVDGLYQNVGGAIEMSKDRGVAIANYYWTDGSPGSTYTTGLFVQDSSAILGSVSSQWTGTFKNGIQINGKSIVFDTRTPFSGAPTTSYSTFKFLGTPNKTSLLSTDSLAFLTSDNTLHKIAASDVGISGSGSQTLQQTFDQETGEALQNKNDTINNAAYNLNIRSLAATAATTGLKVLQNDGGSKYGTLDVTPAYVAAQAEGASDKVAQFTMDGRFGTSLKLHAHDFAGRSKETDLKVFGDSLYIHPLPTDTINLIIAGLPNKSLGGTDSILVQDENDKVFKVPVTDISGSSVTPSSTTTFTNKRWTARVGSTTSSATPTINTDDYDIYKLTAQAADITSFTTNLSGTPNDGDILEIQITGTATRAITWGTSFVSSSTNIPVTTVGTNTLTIIFQYYTASSYGNNKWVCATYY